MRKTGDSKRWLGILLMVLAVLVGGITATSYADPLGPTERVSGPALVGTLVALSDGSFTFNGQCRGFPANFTATPTTPGGLEGLRFNGISSSTCSGQNENNPPQPSNDVIVKNVVNDGTTTAKVVLLWVVSQ
jgi:hypothetical protein